MVSRKEKTIAGLLDTSLPLEQQARQAYELRNQFRIQARELMADRSLAEELMINEPNLSWEQVVQKAIDRGNTGDDVYRYVIGSSQRSRASVNQSLGLDP